MRPGVGADGVAGRINLLEDFRIVGRVLADGEEDAGGAFFGQRLQHCGCVAEPWAVVKGEHHFLLFQEVELLEVLEAEAGTARGVDLDGAADTECVRIAASRARGLCRLCRGRGSRGWSRCGSGCCDGGFCR
jgi:hypothetical protein